MELSLKEKGLWQVVVRGTKAYEEELKLQAELKADAAERKVQLIKLEKKAESANNKALAKLVFSLDEHQQHLIYEENDARAAWDKMIKMFGQNTVANQMRIVQQLQHMTVEGDMNAHVSKMQQLNTMLRQMDAQLAEPDPKMVLYLLNSLRRSPEWKDQVYTLSKLKLTFADLAAHLLEEETTRKLFMDEEQSQVANSATRMNRARRTQEASATTRRAPRENRDDERKFQQKPRRPNETTAKRPLKCYVCGAGHPAFLCPKRYKDPEEDTAAAAITRLGRVVGHGAGQGVNSQICKGGNASCQGHWWSKGVLTANGCTVEDAQGNCVLKGVVKNGVYHLQLKPTSDTLHANDIAACVIKILQALSSWAPRMESTSTPSMNDRASAKCAPWSEFMLTFVAPSRP